MTKIVDFNGKLVTNYEVINKNLDVFFTSITLREAYRTLVALVLVACVRYLAQETTNSYPTYQEIRFHSVENAIS